MTTKSAASIQDGETVWQIRSQDGGLLIILVLVLIGVGIAIFNHTYAIWNLNWPEVEGEVVVHYQHDLKYAYKVGEMKYTRRHYGLLDSFAYANGDKVKVRYEPENPLNSRLDLGFSLDVLALALVETATVLATAYLFKTRFRRVIVEKVEDEYTGSTYRIEYQD